MNQTAALGAMVQSYFTSHLIAVKGLRPATVRSYRDTTRLFLIHTAAAKGCPITRLAPGDLTFEAVTAFLLHLERDRGNQVRTRNQRLAAIRSLFEYLATRSPELLGNCQRVAAIPDKRTPPAQMSFLEKDEAEQLLASMPRAGRHALRDRTLMLFLYNTGARASETAALRTGNLRLDEHPLARLHGKGGKWRTVPLWQQTGQMLAQLTHPHGPGPAPDTAVFCSGTRPLTRSGIYKIIRRHAAHLDDPRTGRIVSPHTFRHTAAVHLLESGVEVNVIREWLGHADLSTTNRYAEINTKLKEAAIRACEPPATQSSATPAWKSDETLLNWLAAL